MSLLSGCAAAAQTSAMIPEENYDFLSVTDGPCVPKIGVGIEAKYEAECKRMTEPRRYRGTWYVDFETSFFTPAGRRQCWGPKGTGGCLELKGEALPWPKRSDCGREFEVDFIGRRNVLPTFYPAYTIVVDQVISARRLPDPPHDADECDAAAP